MFDIAFSELVFIALIALVVLGPERLPKVARTAGHLLGRLQRYVSDVKADINREIQLDELRKLQSDVEQSARSFESSINQELKSAEESLKSVGNSILPPDEAGSAQPSTEHPPGVAEDKPEAPEEKRDEAQLELGFDSSPERKTG